MGRQKSVMDIRPGLEVSISWPYPPGGDVRIWRASLPQPAHVVEYLAGSLSPEELRRADRYVYRKDRVRFVTARGLLRRILADYLPCVPEDVRFSYGPAGKPEIDPHAGTQPVYFNLSHSGDLVMIAVCCSGRIGIDVERVRPVPGIESLVEQCFTAREQAQWLALPDDQKTVAFFHGWTRKEACMKAAGFGLGLPPKKIQVTIGAGRIAQLIRVGTNAVPVQEWSLVSLDAQSGYVAALAVETEAHSS